MITRVLMPKFNERMTQGVILNWKMDEGQAVVPGQILVEIETDTAVMELESSGSGFLRHILINEGMSVKAGTVVAVIGDLDDDIDPTLTESIKLQKMAKIDPRAPRMTVFSRNKPQPRKEEAVSSRNAHTHTSPTLSSPARENEPVTAQDVDEARNSSPQSKNPVIEEERPEALLKEVKPVVEEVHEVVEDILEDPSTPVNELVEELPAKASTTDSGCAPHFHITTEISMAEGERLREQMMDIQRTTLCFTTLYVRTAVLTFSRHPEFQRACLGYQTGSIDIGIAIPVEDRVQTPIIRNCGRKNIAELSDEIEEITRQTRANQWTSEEDVDSLFSIANFGMYPIEHFIPILSSSQTASLAMGAIRSVHVHQEGIVTVDRRMTVSLSCNYHTLDEDQAARLLKTFKQILERPLEIFLPNPVE